MKIFAPLRNVKNRLTKIGEDEPLNFLSILVIIALDIFVLWNVFQGLDMQTRQLVSPSDAVPYQCQNLTDVNKWNDDTRWQKVYSVLEKNTSYYYSGHRKHLVNESRNNQIVPACRAVYDAADAFRGETGLKSKLTEIRALERSISSLNSQINQRRDQYDTTLLETIAGQTEDLSITTSTADQTRSDIETRQAGVSRLQSQITSLRTQIMSDPATRSFLETLQTNRETITSELKTRKFWYPLKRLAFQLVFLLPLLIVFGLLYKWAVKKGRPLLTLIFSHILVIVCIPIIIEFFRLFLEIIPFHFFADFLDLLEALGLVALWSYLLILFGIAVALFVIYLAQKKLFSRERMQLKRVGKQQCVHCGAKQIELTAHCYKCGRENMESCRHCKTLTYSGGAFCRGCGKSDF